MGARRGLNAPSYRRKPVSRTSAPNGPSPLPDAPPVGAALVAARARSPLSLSKGARSPFALREIEGLTEMVAPYTNSSIPKSSIAATTREISVCCNASRCAPPMSSRGRAENDSVIREGPMAHSR